VSDYYRPDTDPANHCTCGGVRNNRPCQPWCPLWDPIGDRDGPTEAELDREYARERDDPLTWGEYP